MPDALVATQFAAAALMFLLAGWLLRLGFTTPVNRAFALFLAVRGLGIVANRVHELSGNAPYWEGVGGYFLIAGIPTLAYFLLVAAGPPRLARSPAARWSVLALAVAAELLYAADHCLHRCAVTSGLRAVGPLGLLSYPLAVGEAAASLVLMRRALAAPTAARRQADALLAVAFLLNAALDASIVLGLVAAQGVGGALAFFEPSPWSWLALSSLLALPPLAAALALSARFREPADRRRAARAAALVPLAGVTGVLVGASPPAPDAATATWLAAAGLWRMLLPALATYAIVRHQLFDLDVKVRRTIRQSTVVGAFLLVFFTASEVAKNLLSASAGPFVGVLAAGVLAIAIGPIQRGAEAFARRALPEDAAILHRRADEAFRSAVELALADGVVNRAEERALAKLATQLGLDPTRALRIREEAEARQPA